MWTLLRNFSTTFIFLLVVASIWGQTYGENGMVVSDHHLASEVGVDILKQGGNAIDAAVATAFALAVTHPEAGNIGGGGFLVYSDNEGKATTIDFREKAPLAATKDMFLEKDGKTISRNHHHGALSIGVPGTVAGLYLAHQKYGSLPWPLLVQPSIELADKGFTLGYSLHRRAQALRENSSDNTFISNFFCNGGSEIVPPNDVWKQENLAKTLRAIRDYGEKGFYEGWVAEEIQKFMKQNGGIITKEDLKKYEAIEREPIKGTYKGYEIIAMPPPSSGGIAVVEMLNILENADLENVEFNSTDYVHLVAESMRRVFADRAEHLGDPDFNQNMPVDLLISKEHARKRFESINIKKASSSNPQRYGQLYGGKSTTHFSVVDAEGRAVSLTYTLEHSYGSKMGSNELGFIFNNEMGDFNPKEGYTNERGTIGTQANLIAPEKRMLSSMSPTIVTKNGKVFLVVGSPGGRTIINTVFQTVLAVLEYDMGIKPAIEAMKIHHQWLPNTIYYEKHLLSPDTRNELEKRGHVLKSRNRLGKLMAIQINGETGIITGASDSSSPDGAAVGY